MLGDVRPVPWLSYNPHNPASVALATRNVDDCLFFMHGKIEKMHLDIILLDGEGPIASSFHIKSYSYVDHAVLRHVADRMQALTVVILETCNIPHVNNIDDGDLAYLIAKRGEIRELTLNNIPQVTTDGLLHVIKSLRNLHKFSTNLPLDARVRQALLERGFVINHQPDFGLPGVHFHRPLN